MIERKLIGLTLATWSAIDAARKDGESRAALIERSLWKTSEIKKAGVSKELRPRHGGKR